MKSKKRVYISFRLVLILVLFLTGAYNLLKGIYLEERIRHAIPLEQLTADKCPANPYVYGYISTYVVDRELNGFSCYDDSKGPDQLAHSYVIPLSDGRFLTTWIYARHLEHRQGTITYDGSIATLAPEDVFYYEGIVNHGFSQSLTWIRNVDIFRTDSMSLLQDYQIRETSFDQWKPLCINGTLLILSGVAILIYTRKKDPYVVEVAPTPPRRVPKRCDYEYEVKAEQLRLKALEKRLLTMKNTCHVCICLLPVSWILWKMDHFLIALVLLATCVSEILIYWSNRGGTHGEQFMTFLDKTSVYTQIEKTKMLIADYQKETEKEESP